MISSNKQINVSIILNYVQMALSIVISLIYTPIMINILGNTEYGIYNLVSSIISFLTLLSLGLSSSYVHFYSIKKVKNDEEGIAKLNGLFLISFIVIGIIALICSTFIAFNVNIFFNETYSSADKNLAKILMLFLGFNLAVSFPASVFLSYITSQEQFIFQKTVNIGRTVLSPCLCIVALFLGYGSIGMVIVTTCISLIIDFCNFIFCTKKLKMKFCFRNLDFSQLKAIFGFSFFIAISEIINQINWQTDKIILGKMIDASAVAIYTVAATINTLYLSFSTAISSVFAPRINLLVSSDKEDLNEKLNQLFVQVGRIQFFILGLILSGFIFFGKYFITIWVGEFYLDAYYIALLLICPVTIPLIQNIGIEIQMAKNKHQFRSIVYLFMALLNIGISILFCKLFGTIGTAMGTALSLIVANFLIMNIYYQKKLSINILAFWKEIFICLLGLIIPTAFGVVIRLFIPITNILFFLLLILAYTLVYCVSVFFLGLNKNEKNFLLRFLKKEKNADNSVK